MRLKKIQGIRDMGGLCHQQKTFFIRLPASSVTEIRFCLLFARSARRTRQPNRQADERAFAALLAAKEEKLPQCGRSFSALRQRKFPPKRHARGESFQMTFFRIYPSSIHCFTAERTNFASCLESMSENPTALKYKFIKSSFLKCINYKNSQSFQ